MGKHPSKRLWTVTPAESRIGARCWSSSTAGVTDLPIHVHEEP
jgi:hypothetical protein